MSISWPAKAKLRSSRSRLKPAFTLIELLVVLSIIGVLIGLLLPAVQSAREAARRTHCSNNLHNIGIAIHSFADINRTFPAGSESLAGTEHAWSTKILPHLEHSTLYQGLDQKAEWNSPNNQLLTLANISTYRCPSAEKDFSGKQDYGGIQGTSLTQLPIGLAPNQAFGCGSLIVTSASQSKSVRIGDFIDGLSTTICVGESSDRDPLHAGRWACGRNCFSQNAPKINRGGLGDLLSKHSQGAQVLFADGHCQLLNESIDSWILGSICTRNGSEPVGDIY